MIVALLLVLLAVSPAAANAENLLENSGFESSFSDSGVPAGWLDNSSWADLDVTYARETENPHSGAACLRLTCTRFADGAVQFIQKPRIAIRKGKTYRVSAWLRADMTDPVAVMLRKGPPPWTVYAERAIPPTAEWQKLEYFYTSTVDEPRLYVMTRMTSQGTLWLDDLWFEEVTAEQARALSPPVEAGNLLENGSFELGQAGWLLERCGFEGHSPKMTIEQSNGEHCLRVDVPVEGRHTFCHIHSTRVPVSVADPVAISCRIRASEPTDVEFGSRACKVTRTVGTEWQTLTASSSYRGFSPAETDGVRFLTRKHPVTLWVDDVQLRQDGQTEGERFSAAIISDRFPLGLYHDGDDVNLRLMAYAPRDAEPREITWSVFDFWGKEALSGTWLPGSGRQETAVSCRELPRGWYRADLTWQDGERVKHRESTFVLLPQRHRSGDPRTSPFGAHFAGEDGIALATAVGARWNRMHAPVLTKWKYVEPRKSEWHWPDAEIRAMKDAGIEILGSLDRAPDWAARDPHIPPRLTGRYFFGYAGRLPRDWREWENYVERIVARYRGLIDRWEIGNEMDDGEWLVPPAGMARSEAYFELLKHTYPVVKRANHEATVVGFALMHQPKASDTKVWRFVNGVLDLGGLKYMDAFSYHAYIMGAIDERKSDAPAEMAHHVMARLRQAGGQKTLVCSEGGFSEVGTCLKYRPWGSGVPASEMPKYLVRQYLSQWFAGVERFYFYNFHIGGRPYKVKWQGLVEGEGQPTPNVAAYATMTWLLDGATPDLHSPRVRRGPNLWVYTFTTPRGPLLVVCAKTGTVQRLSLPTATGCWDLMGAEQKLPKDGELKVTDAPMYVLLKG